MSLTNKTIPLSVVSTTAASDDDHVITSGDSDAYNPVTVSTRYIGKIGGANRSRRLMDFIKR